MTARDHDKDAGNLISSVERALDVMLYINSQNDPVGISEISKALGVYKSTVFRTLITLQSKNFVRQDEVTGKYSLGISLLSMAQRITVYDVFKPFADSLCKEFKEAINVSVLESQHHEPYRTILVVKSESNNNVLSVNPQIGSSSPCYCSSVGKCLLAFHPHINDEALKKYSYIKYTENTIDSYEKLISEIEKVRKAGYAMDDEEQEMGLTCIGVPLFDREGKAIASLSLSGPTTRVHALSVEHIVNRLKSVASEIRNLL